MIEEQAVLTLKDELYSIRQRINREKDPIKKTKMVRVYRKLSKALTKKML